MYYSLYYQTIGHGQTTNTIYPDRPASKGVLLSGSILSFLLFYTPRSFRLILKHKQFQKKSHSFYFDMQHDHILRGKYSFGLRATYRQYNANNTQYRYLHQV